MIKYTHTNIIAKDALKLIQFYKYVFECKSIGEIRDIKGGWLDQMTGIQNAHIIGEHLSLPGYDQDYPTLEIFSYDEMKEGYESAANRIGIAHLAFEVDDVERMLHKVMEAGGGQIGEVVTTDYPNNKRATFVYATDLEGNIIELQSWETR